MGWTKHKLNHRRHPQATQKDTFCYNRHVLRRSSCYLWFLVRVMGKIYKCSAGTQSLWVSLASVCWTSSILLSHGGSCRRRMSGRAGYFVTRLKSRSVSSGNGQVVSKETLVLEAFCKQVLLFIVARQQLLAAGKLDNSSPGRRGAVEFTDLEILGKSMSRLPLSWELNRFVLKIANLFRISVDEFLWMNFIFYAAIANRIFRSVSMKDIDALTSPGCKVHLLAEGSNLAGLDPSRWHWADCWSWKLLRVLFVLPLTGCRLSVLTWIFHPTQSVPCFGQG